MTKEELIAEVDSLMQEEGEEEKLGAVVRLVVGCLVWVNERTHAVGPFVATVQDLAWEVLNEGSEGHG